MFHLPKCPKHVKFFLLVVHHSCHLLFSCFPSFNTKIYLLKQIPLFLTTLFTLKEFDLLVIKLMITLSCVISCVISFLVSFKLFSSRITSSPLSVTFKMTQLPMLYFSNHTTYQDSIWNNNLYVTNDFCDQYVLLDFYTSILSIHVIVLQHTWSKDSCLEILLEILCHYVVPLDCGLKHQCSHAHR